MRRWFVLRLTALPWQIALSFLLTALVAGVIYTPKSGVDLSELDRATFITALSAIATLVALFCSLSLSWILFTYQQVKGLRTASYDMMKQCLMEAECWLNSQEQTEITELCHSLIWEIDKIQLSEVPRLDSIDEYEAYCKALDWGINSEDFETRRFFQRSGMHFTRIEELLSRFGVASIQQVLINMFINTLAKGFAIVVVSVIVLLSALLWYSEQSRVVYVLAATFLSIATILILFEVWVDLKREYEDELDFVLKPGEV